MICLAIIQLLFPLIGRGRRFKFANKFLSIAHNRLHLFKCDLIYVRCVVELPTNNYSTPRQRQTKRRDNSRLSVGCSVPTINPILRRYNMQNDVWVSVTYVRLNCTPDHIIMMIKRRLLHYIILYSAWRLKNNETSLGTCYLGCLGAWVDVGGMAALKMTYGGYKVLQKIVLMIGAF